MTLAHAQVRSRECTTFFEVKNGRVFVVNAANRRYYSRSGVRVILFDLYAKCVMRLLINTLTLCAFLRPVAGIEYSFLFFIFYVAAIKTDPWASQFFASKYFRFSTHHLHRLESSRVHRPNLLTGQIGKSYGKYLLTTLAFSVFVAIQVQRITLTIGNYVLKLQNPCSDKIR